MKLFFDWSESFYEKKENWRNDEEMISLKISQRECGFAVARVVLASCSAEKFLQKKYAKIGVQKNEKIDLIFAGRLVSFPVNFGNTTTTIELIAEPDDYQAQLKNFSEENFEKYKSTDKHEPEKNLISFDDLFFSETDLKNPTIFLESGSKIFYWDPRSGKLSLSHINFGKRNFDVFGNDILQNSLKVTLSREPYKNANVTLDASWIQHIGGFVDVFPMIAQKFQLGIINSYTNIKSALERIGNISNKNGYFPINCEINEIIPPKEVGFLKNYPLISPKFAIQGDQKGSKKDIFFKRFYLNGKIILGWSYKQKRTEEIKFNVVNPNLKNGREKSIHIKLGALQLDKNYPNWNPYNNYETDTKIIYKGDIFQCTETHVSDLIFDKSKWKFVKKIPDALKNDQLNSFFKTQRGNNAIKYALQKAIALINYSSRYVEINFEVDAKNYFQVTLNDQVTIYDSRFVNGKIIGKVTKIKFSANADIRIMHITIGCCPSGNFENYQTKLNDYCEKLQIDELDCCPKVTDIVTGIEIQNPPEEQEKILGETEFKNLENLKSQLRSHTTKIKIALHPFSVMREIRNKIKLPNFNL